ncbi:hypothetical protein GQ602_006290 [Ophiocordyceps camponoti-floridani]|uniref:HAUS augmin-like complex subunit 6 N-terminal domain-containing protein n=1 Tax=Ophiocordyceps camponoti-floridani TaxID=2030778 RepID=A0A8H4Q309_9HYPO|nr:hypothetical protein GQ602_006290 [Ophiocordyceps camponoti-floridani]
MASHQHARTRSAASLSRPQERRLQGGGPTNGFVKTNIPIFLTNLRLLDLDLRPDWPHIKADMFEANTSLKREKRVECVEWVLFHLFSLLDPDEAAAKLKPYFPPSGQSESLSLRVGLLRALEGAKRSGLLGRECVIRKTMLDDCRGDRFEEVLAYISTAALKAKVARDKRKAACRLPTAFSSALETEDVMEFLLFPLELSYRVSLCRLLARKEAAQVRYVWLAREITTKERSLAESEKSIQLREQDRVYFYKTCDTDLEDDMAEIHRKIDKNWSDNEGWKDAILGRFGGTVNRGIVARPFDAVWRGLQEGRTSELADDGKGLTENLEGRIRVLEERVKRWQAFRDEIVGTRHEAKQLIPKDPDSGSPAMGLDLSFREHESLQVRNMNDVDVAPGLERRHNPLNHADDEARQHCTRLQMVLDKLKHRVKTPHTHPYHHMMHARPSTSVLPPPSGVCCPDRQSSDDVHLSEPRPCGLEPVEEKYWSGARTSRSSSGCSSPTRQPKQAEKPVAKGSTPYERWPLKEPLEPAKPDLRPVNHAKTLEDKPDAPRHTLSLSERTCLSMSRTDGNASLQEPEPEPGPAPKPAEEDEPTAAIDDLINRTRRSMAGFEKAQQKAKLERRRSERKARMSPRKESALYPTPEEGSEQTAASTLDPGDEDDVEAVFRSRPKVMASPIASPMREGRGEDE